MQGAHTAFGEHLTTRDSLLWHWPMGSRVTADKGGGLQAGDSGAVPPPGGGSSLLHLTFQQHKMPQTHFLEKGEGI